NLSGIFDLDLSPDGIFKGRRKSDAAAVLQPLGSQASFGGLGAGILVTLVNNTPTARIDPGALVHTGADGEGLAVHASNNVFELSLVQAGGKAGSVGFSGAAAAAVVNANTTAQVQSGVTITGGKLDLDAADDSVLATLAGSVQRGNRLGFGFTV